MRYEVHIRAPGIDGWINAFEKTEYNAAQFKTKKEAMQWMQIAIDSSNGKPDNFKIVKAETIKMPRRPRAKIQEEDLTDLPDTSQTISWKDLIAEATND